MQFESFFSKCNLKQIYNTIQDTTMFIQLYITKKNSAKYKYDQTAIV